MLGLPWGGIRSARVGQLIIPYGAEGGSYCREVSQCENAQKTCLAAGTVANDD